MAKLQSLTFCFKGIFYLQTWWRWHKGSHAWTVKMDIKPWNYLQRHHCRC